MQTTSTVASPVPMSPLAHRVLQQLVVSGHSPLRTIQVHEKHGTVVLRGSVPTYYLKQVAQVIARSVRGVAAIQNEMMVASAG
jgi:osmotically-inducible protein OsmY